MSGFLPTDPKFASKALHVGQEPEKWNSMAVVPHISMATTFKQDAPADFRGFEYSRSGNPTRQVLEECLSCLDDAKYACTFSSGLAATNVVTSLLSAGDHLVCMDDLYGGTNRFFRKIMSRMGIEPTFVDCTKPENVKAALRPNTKMVWMESPSNPVMKVTDIKAVSDIAHEHGNIIVVVDNTFVTGYFQRPLNLGADIVLYSISKYINGHSDVIMGSVAMNDEGLHERVKFLQNAMGPVPSPFDCYLVNRSIKTLKLRMEEHFSNGLKLAKYLESHPYVSKVLHPALPSHPQHEIVKKQTAGHSGIFSFYHKGGLEESKKLLSSLKLVTLAESLGGYESLAELPYLMTHASIEEKERVALGVTNNLIRISVGLESADDIIDDIKQALEMAQK